MVIVDATRHIPQWGIAPWIGDLIEERQWQVLMAGTC
jgi:hypothetical protein